MNKKEVVGSMSESSGVLKDLFRQINDGSIELEQVQSFLEHKNPFIDFLSDWQNFYQKVFKVVPDFSNLKIPKKKQGFTRLIIVAERMSPHYLYNTCCTEMLCSMHLGKNLNEVVQSERTSKRRPYAVWVRDRVEADKELKNLSVEDLKERKIIGITLEERLLYELKYFRETGKHLDVHNVTLCSGSLYSDGRAVPSVYWRGSLHIDGDGLRAHENAFRSRRVVL